MKNNNSIILIIIACYLCSCGVPMFLFNPESINVSSASKGQVQIERAIMFTPESKQNKKYSILQTVSGDSLLTIDVNNIFVCSSADTTHPKIYYVIKSEKDEWKYVRIKNVRSPSPFTLFMKFKMKTIEGDTIKIIERNLTDVNDSVVICLGIPENIKKEYQKQRHIQADDE